MVAEPQVPVPPNERRRIRRRVATLNAQRPAVPSIELPKLEIAFNGAWISDEDALKVGNNNFADLRNLRYTDVGLEGVSGYSRINTVALASPALRSGIQFVKLINAAPTSHILVQAGGLVYQHLIAPPAQGNFAATTLFTDSAGAGLGRFALAPDGNVLYCNGVDTVIWGSAEHRAGAVINYDDPAATFRYDITDRMQNTLTDVSNRFTLVDESGAGRAIWLLVGSTRPLQGIKCYVQNANTGASTTTVEYWNGSAWTSVGGFADGTAVGGVTLAQTGALTFTNTVSTARVRLFDERVLYFYRVRVGATGTPDTTIALAHVTVDAPMQPIGDIWDGVERRPIHFDNGFGQDFTLEVLEPSSLAAPLAAEVGGGAGVVVVFEERMTALRMRMIATRGNTTAATVTVSYWNGTAFTSVGAVTDDTALAGATLGRSGDISWNAPPATSEAKRNTDERERGAEDHCR